jgi:hypothetical protein
LVSTDDVEDEGDDVLLARDVVEARDPVVDEVLHVREEERDVVEEHADDVCSKQDVVEEKQDDVCM